MAAAPRRILVVEDEPAFAAVARFHLRRAGYAAVLAADGAAALAAARRAPPDLVLLDLGLPDGDGREVCRRLRARSPAPIVVVSARGGLADKVALLEQGADDYLAKPIAWPELLARIAATLRRADRPAAPADPDAARAAIAVGALRVEPGRCAAVVGGREIPLRAKECALLTCLARHQGQVLSREQLMRQVWGVEHGEDTRTVDVHIRWLREKIEDDPSRPRRLLTLRHVGYRLVPAE